MSRFTSISLHSHSKPAITGVLLVNLGTPEAPTAKALRRYLAEFLWDTRVVEVPRFLWWLVLHLVILRIRPRRSANLYKEIWTERGSPLRVYSQHLAEALQRKVDQWGGGQIKVALAMRYGQPSVKKALNILRDAGVQKLLVLPLYPQYSATTTAAVFDAVSSELQRWRRLPETRFINHYHDFPAYIDALADSVRNAWQARRQGEKLVFSFHGIPQRYFAHGDPYYCECQKTARLVAEALALSASQWLVTFQSRFGRQPWLQPYTDVTLKKLAAEGVKRVDVICPGFACDCLETLSEIAIENRNCFYRAGGGDFDYIPALNDRPEHVAVLSDLIASQIAGWSIGDSPDQCKQTAARARQLGAKN